MENDKKGGHENGEENGPNPISKKKDQKRGGGLVAVSP